ncbi:MAG: CP12 domain-containing protein [Nodosilinea sp.]
MSATTAAFTATTTTTTVERKPSSESQMRAALEHARRLTAMNGHHNREVAIAWEVVEELQFAQRRQRATVQSAFAQYCLANPDAIEARMYDV